MRAASDRMRPSALRISAKPRPSTRAGSSNRCRADFCSSRSAPCSSRRSAARINREAVFCCSLRARAQRTNAALLSPSAERVRLLPAIVRHRRDSRWTSRAMVCSCALASCSSVLAERFRRWPEWSRSRLARSRCAITTPCRWAARSRTEERASSTQRTKNSATAVGVSECAISSVSTDRVDGRCRSRF